MEELTFAVRVMALFTVTVPNVPAVAPPTLIPGPKLAFVVPLAQCVNSPVMDTLVEDCVGAMLFGVIVATAGTPAITLNVAVKTCEPVVMVTLCEPIAALFPIVTGIDALVGPFTVITPCPKPTPKLAVVDDVKLVPLPVITIV